MRNIHRAMFHAAVVFCFLTISGIAYSQQTPSLIKGHFSGSYENYSQYYMKDTAIDAIVPPDRIGINSFLKLDYNHSKFSAGIQFESYLPPILGFYPIPVEGRSKIVNKYFKYTDDKFAIQVGDFYEQFGSGLIFRAWENRQIGINNALEGASIYAEPVDFMKVKLIYGRARRFYDHTDAVTRGADLEFDINNILGKEDAPITVSIGGSYVGKYEEYAGPIDNFPSTVNAFAGRFDISHADFSLDAEYVSKSKDPHLLNNNSFDRGSVFLLNGSFTKNNFGGTFTYRTLYNMDFTNERGEEFPTIAPVNYIPALTKQHDYLTSNIYVYAAQFRGESGFQTDLFYTFLPGTKLGGKYGMKLAANYSRYTGLNADNQLFSGGEKYFSDANFEVKKKWSKKFEATLGLQHLFYNTSVIRASASDNVSAYVVALGGLYKWSSKKSLRMKFEHLGTDTDDGSWAAAVAEFSFSSPWLFFVSDLYNYGRTDIHYYNMGLSYTKKATRASLSFGKQRPGLFCAGGVCRFVPASYGFTATLTTSFAN